MSQIRNNSYQNDKLYSSFTDVFMQGKHGSKTLRANSKSSANAVLMDSYVPSFTQFLDNTSVQTYYDDEEQRDQFFNRLYNRQLFYTYLSQQNMLYHPAFENKNCTYNYETNNFTLCAMPTFIPLPKPYKA